MVIAVQREGTWTEGREGKEGGRDDAMTILYYYHS
jgi:hypothetical protein